MENVNGRKLVESGQLCERKNGRGVDPNRNWDAHWGFKESDYDPAEEFPGAAPFRCFLFLFSPFFFLCLLTGVLVRARYVQLLLTSRRLCFVIGERSLG